MAFSRLSVFRTKQLQLTATHCNLINSVLVVMFTITARGAVNPLPDCTDSEPHHDTCVCVCVSFRLPLSASARQSCVHRGHLQELQTVRSQVLMSSYLKDMPYLKRWPGSSHVGFVVDKSAVGQVFSEYLGFHRLLHTQPHPPSGAGTVGQTVADVPSGLSLTPPQGINYPPISV
jgi:hypothetical protein